MRLPQFPGYLKDCLVCLCRQPTCNKQRNWSGKLDFVCICFFRLFSLVDFIVFARKTWRWTRSGGSARCNVTFRQEYCLALVRCDQMSRKLGVRQYTFWSSCKMNYFKKQMNIQKLMHLVSCYLHCLSNVMSAFQPLTTALSCLDGSCYALKLSGSMIVQYIIMLMYTVFEVWLRRQTSG